MQRWFSCEQCNRAWKSSSQGSTSSVKICEPCIVRCHQGHKGIRFISHSVALCICSSVCQVTACKCNALEISSNQIKVQSEANAFQKEKKRKLQRNIDSPPVFAMVPRMWKDGTLKSESGWMICRRYIGAVDEYAQGDGELLANNIPSNSNSYISDSETSADTSTLADLENQSLDPIGSQSLTASSKGGSILDHYLEVPLGWIEVYDVEEPELLRYGDRVLCLLNTGIPKAYGSIRSIVKPGFYKVKFDEKHIGEESVERSNIELISRPRFYCNLQTGQSTWNSNESENIYETQTLNFAGPQWVDLFKKSKLRRTFDGWDEMYCPYINQIFYLNTERFKLEKSVLILQSIYRSKFRKSRPFKPWSSLAFTFDTPDEVHEQKMKIAGWAFLRRRSKSVGDFVDKDGIEWEEYTDNKTSEYFYWEEEENLYKWEKPEIATRTEQTSMYQAGEEVLYKFPGKKYQETAIITKVRYDDQTGEDMYDLVHKFDTETVYKWISKMNLKQVPKEGDEVLLAKLEIKWINQIRRKREADERKEKREKVLKVQKELERLENMKTMAYRYGKKGKDEGEVSMSTRLMRARLERIELESLEARHEEEMKEGFKRREFLNDEVDKIKKSKDRALSRAEILSITRYMEMKIKQAEKIEKRNKLQVELDKKRMETLERTKYIEEVLKNGEVLTSTPRSLERRFIVRRMHIAMKRQYECFMVCEWGCGDWFKIGYEQAEHQLRRCPKRILGCTLGCDLKHSEEFWLSAHEESDDNKSKSLSSASNGQSIDLENESNELKKITESKVITYQQYHETEECPKRLIICPLECLEWIPAEKLDYHMEHLCTKRPAKPLECRLGCGMMFGGKIENLIQAEDDRMQHENEECDYRMVRCNWQFDDGKTCAAQIRAIDRPKHRDYHLSLQGIMTYAVAGVYLFKVPKNLFKLKVQVWGAGGGSGCFHGRQGGSGGGGSFVETIIDVEPFSVLELTVGSGGNAGVKGNEIEALNVNIQRQRMNEIRQKLNQQHQGMEVEIGENDNLFEPKVHECGITDGGYPGGGMGYGGGGFWASGGGGGYSMLCRKTAKGNQVLIVAGGGGGGGSLDGLPGGGLEGSYNGTLIDPINGSTATVNEGGSAGETGSTYNSAWPATAGEMWQGGNGCEFGAGGGGGYFGGGGGGTSPGLSGGGGGGSSYIYTNISYDHVIIMGHGYQPGGLNHDPPQACGIGDWDKIGGLAGQGGMGDKYNCNPGKSGAIRLIRPGYY